jgi:putative membrane protein
MTLVSSLLFALVALIHVWFMVLEMFLWEKPLGLKTFRLSKEHAAICAPLAKNQGLYNGFLAAGIIWALVEGSTATGVHARIFFGACVIVAGLYGAYSTGKRQILYVQALPATLALAAMWVLG